MVSILDLLEQMLEQNTLQSWLTSAVLFAVAITFLSLARRVVVKRLERLAVKTANKLDDILAEALGKTRFIPLLVLSVWIGAHALALPEGVNRVLNGILLLIVLFQVGVWANSLVAHVVRHFVRLEIEDEASQIATSTALTFVGRLLLWVLVFLLGLDNLGVDVNALIASLGVGGIAVALAAQNILGDLLGSLSIMFDKPFVVGDFIVVGDMPGSVEKIGLKTTKVRALSGEQLVFSNTDLLQSRIRNFKRMEERRIVFSFGVTYETKPEHLREIPSMVREIVEGDAETRFDRCHFKSYGDFALLFETVYWITTPEYSVAMDVQQRVNLALFDRFAAKGIQFAYPTQTLYLAKTGTTPLAT